VARCLGLAALLCAGALRPLAAQQPSGSADRIRAEREQLERVRQERQLLEQRMRELQGSVHDLSEEVKNIDEQADATARAVVALDRQLAAIGENVDETTGQLLRAEDELVVKRAILRRRLVDIYKRGPLYTTEALLAAPSFGELVARYKYLHLVTLRDKALVDRVTQLRDQVGGQRQLLVRLQDDMARSRDERAREEQRLRALEQQRASSLTLTKKQAGEASARLERYRRDESRLANVIASFESERKKADSRPNAPVPSASSLKTGDFGKLDWPVDGSILYQFGRVINPNNTTTRWNGVGIQAAAGTAVRAVASGEVVIAEPIGTYGSTVVVQHGGGDYSVYGSLARIEVQKGQHIAKGATLGTVGTADPDLPPHLHFEIRPRGRAMDPLTWLRAQQ
jgi:septal ring factor EnvC (AmiA/AmiB activator)